MSTVVVLIVGVAGGLLGWASQLPAGPLLGAMLGVAIYNVLTDGTPKVPAGFRLATRILIGATVGSLASATLLRTLGMSIAWALLLSVVVVVFALVLGLLFAQLTGIDRRTSLMGSCPGGIAEMVALAEDSAAKVDLVLGMHLVRKLVVLTGIVVIAAFL